MNQREGLRRAGIAILIGWEAIATLALIDAVREWSQQGPWNKFAGTYQTLPQMVTPVLLGMLIPVALWFAAGWIIRGFTPSPLAATSSTSAALDRAEANLREIRMEPAKAAVH